MKKYVYLFAISLCLGLVACGDDEEDNTVPPASTNTQHENSSSEPEGTITINMTSGSSNNFYDIGLDDVKIHIDAYNNFETSIVTKNEITGLGGYYSGGYVDYDYYVEFASLGKINSLNDITSYPATGWSKSLIVMPGTGYVARIMKKGQRSTSDGYFNGRYTRLYVVEQNTMIGTIVKYQTPFEIPFTLEKTTVELSHYYSDVWHGITGTTEIVKITNGTRDIKVAEKPEWCGVTITSEGNVSISAGKNPNPQPRSGTVVLKNAVCSASIVVTQDVAPVEE